MAALHELSLRGVDRLLPELWGCGRATGQSLCRRRAPCGAAASGDVDLRLARPLRVAGEPRTGCTDPGTSTGTVHYRRSGSAGRPEVLPTLQASRDADARNH